MSTIKLYIHTGCPGSDLARTFFRDKKISIEEVDINQLPKDHKFPGGVVATPLIIIDNETVVGFDRLKIAELLNC